MCSYVNNNGSSAKYNVRARYIFEKPTTVTIRQLLEEINFAELASCARQKWMRRTVCGRFAGTILYFSKIGDVLHKFQAFDLWKPKPRSHECERIKFQNYNGSWGSSHLSEKQYKCTKKQKFQKISIFRHANYTPLDCIFELYKLNLRCL